MRKEQLPRGFSLPPSFYSHLKVPAGAFKTLYLVIDRTYGKRSVCPLSVKAIASILGFHPDTVRLHLRFWQDLEILRLEHPKRGDSRTVRIVLCYRELDNDVRVAADKQIETLPERALGKLTLGQFKAEYRSKKKPDKQNVVKETRGEYVA